MSAATASATAPAPANNNAAIPAGGAVPGSAPGVSGPSASLYAGGLSADVLERDLFDVFSVVGPIYSIRVIRDTVTRRSRGYAYVNFISMKDAERALETLNYTKIKNQEVRLSWKMRDPTLRKSGVGNIFIKNLDKSVDTRALHDTFSQFGNIVSCKISIGDDNESRGYGFVQYQTKEEADKAIEKVNGNKIMDREVTVAHWKPQSERDSAKFSNLFIKNFEKTVTDEQFEQALSKFGNVLSSKVARDENGESKGFGFCQFETHEQAQAAIEGMNEKELFGENKLTVCQHISKVRRQVMRKRQQDERRQKLFNQTQGNNLYVKFLETDCTDDKLREMFAEFGDITSARVAMDDAKSQCRGFGFVCFASQEEATKALTAMNGKIIGTKPLFVSLHQPKSVRQAQLHAQFFQRQQQMMMNRSMPMAMGPMQMGMGMMQPRPGQVMMMPNMGPQGRMMRNNQGYPIAGRQQRGGRRPQQQQGQQPAAGVQYKGTAVNAPAVAPAQPTAAAVVARAAGSSDEDFAKRLANAPPAQQKQMIGERIFKMLMPVHGQITGKITGMLLEGFDVPALLNLLEDEQEREAKVKMAIDTLNKALAAKK